MIGAANAARIARKNRTDFKHGRRVQASGGTVHSPRVLRDVTSLLDRMGVRDDTKLLFTPEAGIQTRVSGVNSYVTKGYDVTPADLKKVESQGVEKIVNGGFDTVDGWTINGTGSEISDGVARLISISGESASLYCACIRDANKWYKLSFDVIGVSNGDMQVGNAGTEYILPSGSTGHIETYIRPADTALIMLKRISSLDITLDNISCEELPDYYDDLSQTTASSQPNLSGNIAPNERLALKNCNGEARYIVHPTISFAANEAWSVSSVIKWNGETNSVNGSTYVGGSQSAFRFYNGTTPAFQFINSDTTSTPYSGNPHKITGEYTNITWVASGLGNVTLYINGILELTLSANTNFTLDRILNGRGNTFFGAISYHRIQSGAMTSDQVLAEYNGLKSIFPALQYDGMESVQIGTQRWATSNFEAVATPMGNVIQEMQANAAVEKITGGDFESGLIGTLTSGDETSTWTLNTTNPISGTQDGLLQVTNTGSSSQRPRLTIASMSSTKRYKVSFDYKVNSGTCIFSGIYDGGVSYVGGKTLIGSGTYNFYLRIGASNSPYIAFDGRNLFNVQLDNVSIQELGWADSQELYDGLIAQGYTEADATKEAAMWCYYNNDPVLGSIYGKLFNQFAFSLLKTDIDSYNIANPTTPWGWNVPSQSKQDELVLPLGDGDADKLKQEGDSYWTEGVGTNSTGFTALPGGYRDTDGTFRGINEVSLVGAYDDDLNNKLGKSMRLIHD